MFVQDGSDVPVRESNAIETSPTSDCALSGARLLRGNPGAGCFDPSNSNPCLGQCENFADFESCDLIPIITVPPTVSPSPTSFQPNAFTPSPTRIPSTTTRPTFRPDQQPTISPTTRLPTPSTTSIPLNDATILPNNVVGLNSVEFTSQTAEFLLTSPPFAVIGNLHDILVNMLISDGNAGGTRALSSIVGLVSKSDLVDSSVLGGDGGHRSLKTLGGKALAIQISVVALITDPFTPELEKALNNAMRTAFSDTAAYQNSLDSNPKVAESISILTVIIGRPMPAKKRKPISQGRYRTAAKFGKRLKHSKHTKIRRRRNPRRRKKTTAKFEFGKGTRKKGKKIQIEYTIGTKKKTIMDKGKKASLRSRYQMKYVFQLTDPESKKKYKMIMKKVMRPSHSNKGKMTTKMIEMPRHPRRRPKDNKKRAISPSKKKAPATYPKMPSPKKKAPTSFTKLPPTKQKAPITKHTKMSPSKNEASTSVTFTKMPPPKKEASSMVTNMLPPKKEASTTYKKPPPKKEVPTGSMYANKFRFKKFISGK